MQGKPARRQQRPRTHDPNPLLEKAGPNLAGTSRDLAETLLSFTLPVGTAGSTANLPGFPITRNLPGFPLRGEGPHADIIPGKSGRLSVDPAVLTEMNSFKETLLANKDVIRVTMAGTNPQQVVFSGFYPGIIWFSGTIVELYDFSRLAR